MLSMNAMGTADEQSWGRGEELCEAYVQKNFFRTVFKIPGKSHQ